MTMWPQQYKKYKSVATAVLTASTSLLLKKSMLAKKIGDGIRKIFTPSGSYIWRESLYQITAQVMVKYSQYKHKTEGSRDDSYHLSGPRKKYNNPSSALWEF